MSIEHLEQAMTSLEKTVTEKMGAIDFMKDQLGKLEADRNLPTRNGTNTKGEREAKEFLTSLIQQKADGWKRFCCT